ncbi:NACHT domain-containing NTPase [Inquilinus sp. Marseille-Q2685]|uniref:NACHT domain-containing protein n=1 Tax=Inquilinus sp. Marseille-Q2685 TaxID=2866581 RepID=UPI001CE40712|nr:NACHT domain-containing protein [Inquilinus sp. Marseille-Q2685]
MTSILEAALVGGFQASLQRLTEGISTRIGETISSSIASLTANFESHLSENFDRCQQIKTIISREKPNNILSIYTNLKFKCHKVEIGDLAFIGSIESRSRTIITGTGGGGKTVFMKYLWLSLFTDPKGRIPIYIELRRMNDLHSENLLSYVFKSTTGSGSKITEDRFIKEMRRGTFIFILDGFDEINIDKRSSIERQILDISAQYKDIIIVVSGRPEDRFEAWQQFSVYTILPFTKSQTLALISKIHYEPVIKKKFYNKVKRELYDKHQSFLSNPLLTTIMLLTFDQYAEIPDKIHLFYGQAFETLFLKHDAAKEGFQRQRFTDLTLDLFRKCFAYFCLFTYHAEMFEFSESELAEYIAKASKATSIKLRTDEYRKDLIESICVMQKNGLDIQFTHRSFQEYFTAVCLSDYLSDTHCGAVLNHVYNRLSDNTVRMLFEMNKDKVERTFIIPNLENLIIRLRNFGALEDKEKCLRFFKYAFMYRLKDKYEGFMIRAGGPDHAFLMLLSDMYFPRRGSIEYLNWSEADKKVIQKIKEEVPELSQGKKYKQIRINCFDEENGITLNPESFYGKPEWVAECGFSLWISNIVKKLEGLLVEINKRRASASRSLDKLLGIT